jgi:hypothetical protein
MASVPPAVVRTVAARVQVDDAPDAHVDDAQEALVLFLELLLVEDLDCEHAVFGDAPADRLAQARACCRRADRATYMSKLSFQ